MSDVKEKIQQLVDSHPIVLFMKGTKSLDRKSVV